MCMPFYINIICILYTYQPLPRMLVDFINQNAQDVALDFYGAVLHETSARNKLRGQMWLPMFDHLVLDTYNMEV